MHTFSVLAFGIFVAGYITARWDLATRLYDLSIFAWENGIVVGATSLPFSTERIVIMGAVLTLVRAGLSKAPPFFPSPSSY